MAKGGRRQIGGKELNLYLVKADSLTGHLKTSASKERVGRKPCAGAVWLLRHSFPGLCIRQGCIRQEAKGPVRPHPRRSRYPGSPGSSGYHPGPGTGAPRSSAAVGAWPAPVRGGMRGHFGDYRRMECILFRAMFM